MTYSPVVRDLIFEPGQLEVLKDLGGEHLPDMIGNLLFQDAPDSAAGADADRDDGALVFLPILD